MGFVRKVALLFLCFDTHTTFAADQGFYFGLNAGQAKYDFDFELPQPQPLFLTGFTPGPPAYAVPVLTIRPNPTFPFPLGGVTAVSGSLADVPRWIPGGDDKATAAGFFVGYRIFPYAAVELAYADLGTLKEYQAPIVTTYFTIPEVRRKLATTGPTVSALALMPVTDRWDLYLRGGMYFADQKISFSSPGLPSDSSTYGSDGLLFGAGTQFAFGDHWTIRLDFQRFDEVGDEDEAGKVDVDVLSLGVLFRL